MTFLKILLSKTLIIFASLICSIFCLCVYENYHVNKFKSTELKISRIELEKIWGKPEKVLLHKKEKSFFYYTVLNEFVFNIDEFEKVELKYME